MTEFLPDGVYLNLDFDLYLSQGRLGSSDMGKLSQTGFGWWWQSQHNPRHKRPDSPHQDFGSALHTLLLEGRAAYRDQYAIAPDPRKYTRVLNKKEEYREALVSLGVECPPIARMKSDEWLDLCRGHLPIDIAAWPNVMSDFDVWRGSRKAVSADEAENLEVMMSLIENDDTPAGHAVKDVLGIGVALPILAEVSFFWTDEKGVRRRARFDRLLPNFTLDLKSLGNWSGRDLKWAIPDHIKKYNYDVQVGDQHVARMLMYQMLQDRGLDCVQGGSFDQRNYLHAMALANHPFEWVWLFYQVPDSTSGRAPIVMPVWEDWKGPHHMSGHRKCVRAREKYLEGVSRFGFDKPWGEVQPVHYTREGHDRSLPISHWGFDMEAVKGEEFLDR